MSAVKTQYIQMVFGVYNKSLSELTRIASEGTKVEAIRINIRHNNKIGRFRDFKLLKKMISKINIILILVSENNNNTSN
jgi:hypothetical protein